MLGGFHALPVLAIDGTPVGLVTSSDLLALLIELIDCEAPTALTTATPPREPIGSMMSRLLEVLRLSDLRRFILLKDGGSF